MLSFILPPCLGCAKSKRYASQHNADRDAQHGKQKKRHRDHIGQREKTKLNRRPICYGKQYKGDSKNEEK
jgi:hypothetical protein